MAVDRRRLVWAWLSVIAIVLLACLGAFAWYVLPRVAPGWVVRNSPFVEPLVRAMALKSDLSGTPESRGGWPSEVAADYGWADAKRRFNSWGAKAIPELRRCLNDRDIAVRSVALIGLLNVEGLNETDIRAFTRDSNPWLRLLAWELLQDAFGDDRVLLSEVGVYLLDDPDRYIRSAVAESFLIPPREFRDSDVTQAYEILVRHIRSSSAPTLLLLCDLHQRYHFDEHLTGDALFPLLYHLMNTRMKEYQQRMLEESLPLVAQDFTKLHERLARMHRGDEAWEPGAEPWMYELLHRLLTHRVTVSLHEVDIADVVAQAFPQANVVIDAHYIAAAYPPVTLEVNDRPLIEAIIELMRVLDAVEAPRWTAGLYLDNGVVVITSPERQPFGQMRGFVPGRRIDVVAGPKPQQILAQWRNALDQRHTIPGNAKQLYRWFSDLSQAGGLPMDVQALEQEQWELDISLHDLPLEQILRFMAGYCDLHMELGPTGLRIEPGNSR